MEQQQAASTAANITRAFAVGMIVQVEARTWPGINKPGGVGSITQLHYSENGNEVISVDVRYTVVGGRERRVPVEHVELAPEFDANEGADSAPTTGGQQQRNQLRDRSGLLGRCKRCGSLRADCGSCDWMAQERLAERARNQPDQLADNTSQHSQRTIKARQNNKRRIQEAEEESLSSSSEDEEQIKADNNRRRRYRRQRANWLRILNEDSATDDSDEEESSDDDDDDPLMARLVELERRRREEKKRKLARKYSKSTMKKRTRRPRSTGLSTLESLEQPQSSTKVEAVAKSTDADIGSEPSSPATLLPPQNAQVEVESPMEMEDFVGDPDISSQDSLPPPPDDGDEMEERPVFTTNTQGDSPLVDAGLDDLEGVGFIQPEGEAAAEHLPTGIVDRTQSIPYKELPVFFDNLMNDIADEFIPDADVDLEQFARKVRDARKANDNVALLGLKEEGPRLYREIQQKVIRDGMDQGRQAMRRMTSSRERRRHKDGMARKELKQFRGTALEVRDVRFDIVAKDAERLLRKAIDALLNNFRKDDDMEVGDDDLGYNSEHSSSEVSDSTTNEDLLATSGTFRSDMQIQGGDDVTLPSFDPHMHATTVRSKKSSSRKRSTQEGTVGKRSRKKRRKHDTSSSQDNTSMTQSRSAGRASRKHKRRQENAAESQQSDSSYVSGRDHSTFDGDSLSPEVMDDEQMPPRPHRQATRPQPRRERASSGLQFSSTGERRPNQVSVLERMEAFARANSLSIDDSYVSDGSQEETAGPRRRRQREQNGRRRQSDSIRTATVDEEVAASFDEDDSRPSHYEDPVNTRSNVSTEAFYRRLERKNGTPPTRHEFSTREPASLSDSCKTLLAKYHDSPGDCIAIFDDVVDHFKTTTPVVRSEAVEAFATLLHLLQDHGSKILMEVALTDNLTGTNSLITHIQLLVFALRLLHSEVHSFLTHDDGLAFELFGREKWRYFVEMIVLQMMDVVHARVQPAWWGLDNRALSGIFEKLIPLRDALGSLVPLVETVSHYTLEKFQCQSWRKFEGNPDSLFLSAVDPQEFKSLLLTGTKSIPTPGSDSVRFQTLKKSIPRCEIETLWLLLAFCAEAPAVAADSSKHRWRLVSALFSNAAGVLSKESLDESSKGESNILPAKDHMTQCRVEMIRFAALISSSALNPMPDSDGFLSKLVQKCVLLQINEYRNSSDGGRGEVLHALDATDFTRISQSWEKSNLLENNTAETDSGRDLDRFKEQSNWYTVGRMTGVQPMSALLQSCVKLSMAWVQQTPKKKARRSRLTQSLNSLMKYCIDFASKLEASDFQGDSHVAAASTFEEAFAVQGSNAGILCAASAYREVAVRLSMIARIGGSHDNSVLLTKEVREMAWETMTNSEMKQRRQRIVVREASVTEKFNGDLIVLFSAAKTMAWLTDLHWPRLDGTRAEQIASFSLCENSTLELDDDQDMLIFLSSCLCSCLDCACDILEPQSTLMYHDEESTSRFENVATVISSICLWLSELCIRSRVALHVSSATAESSVMKLRRAAVELRTSILSIAASTVKQCLLRLTNSTVHSESADVALLSVLGLTRAMVGLASTSVEDVSGEPATNVAESTQTTFDATQSPGDDLFGSMDDAAFMNIDLDVGGDQGRRGSLNQQSNETVDRDSKAFKGLWTILIDMIKSTKPSERFAVLPPSVAGRNSVACMTIPGRIAATNNIGEIIACLAALTSLDDKQDDHAVDSSLDYIARPAKISGWSARDNPDQSYFRSVAQCFYSELCCLSAEYEQCDRLVQNRWDNIVEHFVEAMLDSNTLERFPSMNLKRIKENGGKLSERKQSLRLKLANSIRHSDEISRDSVNTAGARLGKGEKENCPGPAYNSSHLWSFCQSLGKAAARHQIDGLPVHAGAVDENSRLDKLFCELDSDMADRPRDVIPLISLERECMQRFALLRGLLSYSSKNRSIGGMLSFESLSSLIISCCCYQLASIAKGVHYQARHGRKEANDGTISYKHTRLLELQSCYTELTLALLSWILRECPNPRSVAFETTLQCARDQLLSQVLLRKSSDSQSFLVRLYSVVTTGNVSNSAAPRALSTEADESGVLRDIFVAIARRSREIMLHVALDQQQNGMRNIYCLFNAFVLLGTNFSADEEWVFDMIKKSMGCDSRASSTISSLSGFSSPFQQALDSYLHHVSLSRAGVSEELTALHQLRHVAIRQFLVPKLLKDDILLSQKKNMLRLLSHILQVESLESLHVQEGFETHLIANMAKAIASCIRSALESPNVDDNLVCTAFQCSRTILTLSHHPDSAASHENTVLSWSRHSKDENAKPPYALYLWIFASWMNHVGEMLVSDTQPFQDFRSKAVSLTAQGRSIWTDKGAAESGDHVVEESSRLVSLEPKVFVEKENARPVTNVYAKSRSKPTPSIVSSDNVEWTPSPSVRRAVKELQAKVISAL